MSDSQEQVRNLFGLNKEEKILDDFGCSLSETIPILGRLYLTEHYICFGSNLFGFNRKYSIAFSEITSLNLKKSNIEIESKINSKKKFSFSSFTDIQIVYKRIKSMCRSYNDNLSSICTKSKTKDEIIPIILSDSEDSDEDTDEIVGTKSSSRSNKNSEKSNTSNENSPSKNNNLLSESKSNNIINLNSKGNIINDEPKDIEEKNEINEKGIKKNKSMKDLNLKKNLKIEISKNSETEKKRKKSFNSLENINDEKKDKNNSIKNNEIIQNNNDDPEDIKFNPIDDDNYEICRKVINLNPKTFFEKYHTNAFPETSYKKYYEWVGDYSEINVPDWEKIEDTENTGIEKFKRIETFCLALHGVPLINKSNVEKTLTYWIDKDGTYYMKTSSKSQGVPLSDCFLVETTLEFHPYMNNTKTVFRTYVRTNMLKSTLFRSALISQSKKSYNQEVTKWFEFIQEKGDKIEGDYVYRPKKRKNSVDSKHRLLSHGVEKEISQIRNEKHIVEFSDFCFDIFNGIRKYFKIMYEYYFREFDKKTRFILGCFFIIFILLLNIIQGQNNEIRELKKGFNEMKIALEKLTNITMELKGIRK